MRTTILFILFTLSSISLLANKTEYGFGTVISDEYQGSKTASGDTYDKSRHTAAHKTLPFGSIVKVTNMDNNRTVMVKINDRGPFIKGYVIEVSGAASEVLRFKNDKANVKLEVVKEGSYLENSEIKETTVPQESLAVTDDTSEGSSSTETPKSYDEVGERISEGDAPEKEEAKEEASETKKEDPKKEGDELSPEELTTLKNKGYKVYDLYKASTFTPNAMGYGVQVGTFNQLHNVLKETSRLQENWFSRIMLTRSKEGNKTTYKIIIGPFEERASAVSYSKNAAKKGVKGFVTAVQPVAGQEVYQIKAVRPQKEGYAVQVMNLSDSDNVIQEVEKLKKKWFKNILINVVKGADGQPQYKLLLGPFPERKTAESYKANLKKKKLDGFVVDLSSIK